MKEIVIALLYMITILITLGLASSEADRSSENLNKLNIDVK